MSNDNDNDPWRLAAPIDPYYSLVSQSRPVHSTLPAFSTSRGGIEIKRLTAEEMAAIHVAQVRRAARERWRRWLARPFARLAYWIGPAADRPVERDSWE